jgi:hypothetical protein
MRSIKWQGWRMKKRTRNKEGLLYLLTLEDVNSFFFGSDSLLPDNKILGKQKTVEETNLSLRVKVV